jgi:cysteinyl-tRNA synthetase
VISVINYTDIDDRIIDRAKGSADAIRNLRTEAGVLLEDTPSGPRLAQ